MRIDHIEDGTENTLEHSDSLIVEHGAHLDVIQNLVAESRKMLTIDVIVLD